KERTQEGIAIAKKAGKYRGRQKGAIALNGDSLTRFKRFYSKGFNVSDLSREFNVSRPTIYKWIEVLKQRKEIK
ncbi:MAG: recombinase family protein, partial [Bacteroidaceae bacterium]|nr:recombinase family protein [Bacteroidaceae bacterium]